MLVEYEVEMMVQIRLEYPQTKKNKATSKNERQEKIVEKDKNAKSRMLLNFFLDHRNVCGIAYLACVGTLFQQFHKILRTRMNDFTVLNIQLKKLMASVEGLQHESKVKAMSDRVRGLFAKLEEVDKLDVVEE